MTSSNELVDDRYGNDTKKPKNLPRTRKLDKQVIKFCFVRSSTVVSEINRFFLQIII